MNVSGYILSAVLGAVRRQRKCRRSPHPLHPYPAVWLLHMVSAKYSTCSTCNIRRPLLEGKEKATWLRGQSEGESKERNKKRALVYENIPGTGSILGQTA